LSTGRPPGGEDGVQARIRGLCDVWEDVARESPEGVARRVQAGDAMVVLDVDGWASEAHVAALSLRPCPLAVALLGQAGSTHAPAVYDLILADAISAPPELHYQYSERLLLFPATRTAFVSPHFLPSQLPPWTPGTPGARGTPGAGLSRAAAWTVPHAAAASSSSGLLSDAAATAHRKDPKRDLQGIHDFKERRTVLGLPCDGVVVAVLHAPFKLDAPLLRVSNAVLAVAPRAVLWLSKLSAPARRNLLSDHPSATAPEERRNVRVARGRVVEMEGHVETAHLLDTRALADFALDSVWYNGHSTTADVVAAGVPLVTLPGATAVARGAASILLSRSRGASGDRDGARGGALSAGVVRDEDDMRAVAQALARRDGARARLRTALNDALAPGQAVPGVCDSEEWAAFLLAGIRAALDVQMAPAASASAPAVRYQSLLASPSWV